MIPERHGDVQCFTREQLRSWLRAWREAYFLYGFFAGVGFTAVLYVVGRWYIDWAAWDMLR